MSYSLQLKLCSSRSTGLTTTLIASHSPRWFSAEVVAVSGAASAARHESLTFIHRLGAFSVAFDGETGVFQSMPQAFQISPAPKMKTNPSNTPLFQIPPAVPMDAWAKSGGKSIDLE